MIRGFLCIVLALFIDGLQAMVSLAFAVIGANLGTVGGATAGAGAANWFCPSFATSACIWVGGFVGGVAGTSLNPALAAVGVPLGIALGFAVNFTLSVTLGTGLVMLLAFSGMFHPARVIPAYLGEIIPGLNNIPAWTGLVLYSLYKKSKEERFKKLHEAIV